MSKKLQKAITDHMAGIVSRRAYDAARKGRRTSNWQTPSTSANTEILAGIKVLRARSHDLIRNNPYAAKAIRTLVCNIVGTGIRPNIKSRTLSAMWDRWVDNASFDDNLSFYALERLACNTALESGECLVRLIFVDDDRDGIVPLRLQLLEPDFIDDSKNEQTRSGGYILSGREFDKDNKLVAYWLHSQHPNDAAKIFAKNESTRVPASEIVHLFEKTRPGQASGVPRLASVMISQKDLDDYEEATIVRKAAEACIAAIITSPDDAAAIGTIKDDDVEELSAGSVVRLAPGEDVRFSDPTPTQGYSEYVKVALHRMAAGIGIPYSLMTGDLSEVNFSSMRAGKLDFNRDIEQYQQLTFIPLFCKPIMDAWIKAASLIVSVKRDIQVTWTTPRFDLVDPLKEINAEEIELKLGLKSWTRAIKQRGLDPDQLLDEIMTEKKRFEDADINHPGETN